MIALILLIVATLAVTVRAEPMMILVQGAAGEEAYGKQFTQWRQRWEEAGKQGGAKVIMIGADEEDAALSDKSQLSDVFASMNKASRDPLWIVLLGHGTFDGKVARFNLRGPDVSAEELSTWLKSVERPVAVINCSSSSGPFIAALTGSDRVIIAATRSGNEMNFSRFGGFLSHAIAAPAADLDKDGQTSLLEAYLLASRQTQEWYKEEGRLATEHALLEDSGDGLGTPADWFRGVHAVKKAREDGQVDGVRAAHWCLVPGQRERDMSADLRADRDEVELKIASLRSKKMTMSEEEYYAALETLMLQLAKLYEGKTP